MPVLGDEEVEEGEGLEAAVAAVIDGDEAAKALAFIIMTTAAHAMTKHNCVAGCHSQRSSPGETASDDAILMPPSCRADCRTGIL